MSKTTAVLPRACACACALLALASIGCDAPPAQPPSTEALQGLAERMRASFRVEGCEWVTGRGSWRARVSSSGEISVTAHTPPTASAPLLQEEGLGLCATEQAPRAEQSGVLRLVTIEADRVQGQAAAFSARGRLGEGGEVWLDRGDARERLRNTSAGLEQTWHFATRPSGDGDLQVRVAVAGLAHVKHSEAGHHFADAAGRGFRYGHATWVDAAGVRTEIPVTFAGADRTLRMSVPRAVVEASSYPAVLDPVLQPEFALEPVGTMLDVEGFSNVRLAPHPSNGGFIMAWEHAEAGDRQVRVARLMPSPGGVQVLDPGGIDVYGFSSIISLGDLAVSGGTVAITTRVDNGSAFPANARTITFGGGYVLQNRGADTASPHMVGIGGGNFAIALSDRVGGVMQARFLDFPSTSPIIAPSGGSEEERVAGLACGTWCVALIEVGTAPNVTLDLLVWDKTSTSLDRFPLSNILPPGGLLRGGGLGSGEHNGVQRIFGTYVYQDAAGSEIRGFTFDPAFPIPSASTLLPLPTPQISDGTGGAFHGDPVVTSLNGVHTVVWRCGSRLCFRGYEGSGAPVAAASLLVAQGKWQRPDATYFAGGLAVAAEEATKGDVALKAAVFSPMGQSSPWTSIVSPLLRQLRPALSWDGQAFHAVWDEISGGQHRAVTMRLSATGERQDPQGIPITPELTGPPEVAVASCGTSTLMVWTDAHPTLATRRVWGLFTPAGFAANRQQAFLIEDEQDEAGDPAVGCLGSATSSFLVAWVYRDVNAATQLAARRVEPPNQTFPLASGLPPSDVAAEAPAIAGGATGALVAWGDGEHTFGAWVTSAGQVATLGTVGGTGAGIIGHGRLSQPAVAFNGQRHLVAWGQTGASGVEVHAVEVENQNVSPSQQLLSGHAVTAPRIAWTGSEWAVVALDVFQTSNPDVQLRLVGPSPLAEIPGTLEPVTSTTSFEGRPDIAASDAGTQLILFARAEPQGLSTVSQIFGVLRADVPDAGTDGGTDGGEPDGGLDGGQDGGAPKDGGATMDAGLIVVRELTLSVRAEPVHGQLTPGSAIRVTIAASDPTAAGQADVHLSFTPVGLELDDPALSEAGLDLAAEDLVDGHEIELHAHLSGMPGESATLAIVAKDGDAQGRELARTGTTPLLIEGHRVAAGCGGCAQTSGRDVRWTVAAGVLLLAALRRKRRTAVVRAR